MVDLPIPQPQLVTSEDPQSRLSSNAFQRQGRTSIAPGLEALGQGMEDLAVPLAQRQAASDLASAKVERNSDGSINVVTPSNPLIMGRAGQAYQSAVEAGLTARAAFAIHNGLADIQVKNQLNPQGFMGDSNNFLGAMHKSLGNTPLGEAAMRDGMSLQGQYYAGAVREKQAADLETQKGNILARISQLRNETFAIGSQQDGSTTPQFVKNMSEMGQLYQQLKNPQFRIAPDKVDAEFSNTRSLIQSAGMISEADKVFSKTDKFTAQAWARKNILENQGLDLTEPQRQSAYRTVMAHLELKTSGMAAAQAASTVAVDGLVAQYKGNKPVPENEYQVALSQAIASGNSKKVDDLNAARDEYLRTHPNGPVGVTPEQKLSAIQTGAAAAPPKGVLAPSDTPANPAGTPFPGTPAGTAPGTAAAAAARGVGPGSGAGAPAANANPPAPAGPSPGFGYGARNEYFRGPLDSPPSVGAVAPTALYSYLKSKGATNNEALLLTAGAASESMLRPNTIHDSGIGFGFWGHNGDRLAAMRASNGNKPLTWQQMADFGLSELRSRPEAAAVNAAKTPEELANAEMQYEQPLGYKPGSPQSGMNYNGRLNTIRRFIALTGAQEIPTRDYGVQSPGLPATAAPGVGGMTVNGMPYSQAQLDANPYLAPAWLASQKAKREAEFKSAGDVLDSALNSEKHGIDADPDSYVRIEQARRLYPDDVEFNKKYENLMATKAGRLQAAAQTAEMPEQTIEQFKRDLDKRANGAPIYDQNMLEAQKNAATHQLSLRKADPFGFAADNGLIPQKPAMIDPSSAQGMGQAIADRRAASATLGALWQQPPEDLMFSPDDKKMMQTFLAKTDGPGATNLANGLAGGLKDMELQKLMSDPDMKSALVGMTHSGDPEKMGAAYTLMDKVQRSNPLAFDEKAKSDLYTWQHLLNYMSRDDLMKYIQRQNDPMRAKRDEEMDKEADKTPLKNLTVDNVTQRVFGGAIPLIGRATSPVGTDSNPGQAMLDDWKMLFKTNFRDNGNADIAKGFADKELLTTWGPSAANGGVVMKHPPENYYPADDNNSKGYVKEQLDNDLKNIFQQRGIMPEDIAKKSLADAAIEGFGESEGGPLTTGSEAYHPIIPRALVGDAQTEADLAAGKLPSYQVYAQDPGDHMWKPVTVPNAQGAPTIPFRFYADPTMDRNTARELFEAKRTTDFNAAMDAVKATAPSGGAGVY